MPFKKLFGFAKKAKAAGAPRTVVVDVAVKVEQTDEVVTGAEEILQQGLKAQGPVHVSIIFDENGEVTTCKMEHLQVAKAAPAALSNATTLVGSPMPSKPASPSVADDLSQDEPADSSSCSTVVSNIDIPPTATVKIAAQAAAKRTLKADDFRIIRVLGEGGQGLVMLVQDKLTDKLFALKAIKKHRLQTQDLPTVFVEQNVMMTLAGRPLFTSLKGSFEDEDHFFLLTDYCSGGDLHERIRKEGKLPTDVARCYAAQIVLAMEELQQKRIVHRDIKPKNILLTAQDEVIITDFGLARTFGRTAEEQPWRMRKIWQRKEDLAAHEETNTGPQRDRSKGGCGTFGYIAPEMFAGDYSYEVDVWSFAVTLYEMLHGKLPFGYDRVDGATTNELITRTFVVPAEIDSDVDADATDLLQAMLAKDPLKRPTWEQIKEHPWFDSIDWNQIANRKPIPPHMAPQDLHPESHAKYIQFGEPYGEGEAEFPFFSWVSPELDTKESSAPTQKKPKRFDHGIHGNPTETIGRNIHTSRPSMASYCSIAHAGVVTSPAEPTFVHSTATAIASNEVPLGAKTATAVFDAIMTGSSDFYSDRSFSGFSPRWNAQGIYSSSRPRSSGTGRDPTSLPQTTSPTYSATSNVSYDSLQAVALASLAAGSSACHSGAFSATSVHENRKFSAPWSCSSMASCLSTLSSCSRALGSLSAGDLGSSSSSYLKARESSRSRKPKLLTKLQHWWALRGVKEVRRLKGARMDLLG
ncbi:kinase-like protein [Trametes coccinea BRFM310]|uniref:Kinase-like protein n=1 Tax=Trametes coccinea (strain BRFM310) TaxID=1353009 RepID=A0A1Y2IRH3_TRAC3|nr:kinase-like protein [Trametes coccinea BRFM310]